MAERGRTIAVIPARAGSKGIPGKNLRVLAGRSLLQITIDAARESGIFDEIVVSSDGADILEVARRNGVTAVDRPKAFAADSSPTAPSVRHVVASRGLAAPDVVVLLQATSPLRTAAHIRTAIAAYRAADRPLVSIDESPQYPDKLLRLTADQTLVAMRPGVSTLPRQTLQVAYKPNGAIYIFSVQEFVNAGDVPVVGAVAFMMDKLVSIDIDDEADLRLAALILENSHVFDRRS